MKRFCSWLLAVVMGVGFCLPAIASDMTLTSIETDLNGSTYESGVPYYVDIRVNGGSIDSEIRKDFTIDLEVSDNYKGTFKLQRQDGSYVIKVQPQVIKSKDSSETVSYTITCTQKDDPSNTISESGTFDADYTWNETGSDQIYFSPDEGGIRIPEDSGKVTIEFGSDARLVTYIDRELETNLVWNYDYTDAIGQVWANNPGVDIQVVNFTTRPTFPEGDFYLYQPTGYNYLYKFNQDGSFYQVNATVEGTWFKFRESTLGCYVTANGPLVGATNTSSSSNSTDGQNQQTQGSTSQPSDTQQGAQTTTPGGQVNNPPTGAIGFWEWLLSLFAA